MGKLRYSALAASFMALAVVGCNKPSAPEAAKVPAVKPAPVVQNNDLLTLPPMQLGTPQAYEARLASEFATIVQQVSQRVASNAPLPSEIGGCITELRHTTIALQSMQMSRTHDEMVRVGAGRYADLKPIGGWSDDVIDKATERQEKLEADCRRQLPAMASYYHPFYDQMYEDGKWARHIVLAAYAQQNEHLDDYAQKWLEKQEHKFDMKLCNALDGGTNVWRMIGIKSQDQEERNKFSEVSSSFRDPRAIPCP